MRGQCPLARYSITGTPVVSLNHCASIAARVPSDFNSSSAAVLLDDGVVLGQFPPDRSENPDQFGLLMEEGNPLKGCVDAALEELKSDGTLAAIEAQWLSETTGVPGIE